MCYYFDVFVLKIHKCKRIVINCPFSSCLLDSSVMKKKIKSSVMHEISILFYEFGKIIKIKFFITCSAIPSN